MNVLKGLAIYGVVMGLAMLPVEDADAGAGCAMDVTIYNTLDVPITRVRQSWQKFISDKYWDSRMEP